MKTTKPLLLLFMVMLFGVTGFATVSAQNAVFYDSCPYPEGEFYQDGVFPRYELQNQRLLLVNWNTGEIVREIAVNLVATEFRVINWSINCRYLAAGVRHSLGERIYDTHVWDVSNGQLIRLREGAIGNTHDLYWSPDSRYVVIDTRDGGFLWDIQANTSVRLMDAISDGWYVLRHAIHDGDESVLFDMPRDEVLIHRVSGQISIYSLATGNHIGSIDVWTIGYYPWERHFFLSNDGSRIVITSDDFTGAIAVVERSSLSVIRLNTDSFSGSRVEQVAISPDNRYIVSGFRAIRVWDLQNLPANVIDRQPIHRHEGPLTFIRSLRFIDNTVIETNSGEGVQRWDILTGAQVP